MIPGDAVTREAAMAAFAGVGGGNEWIIGGDEEPDIDSDNIDCVKWATDERVS